MSEQESPDEPESEAERAASEAEAPDETGEQDDVGQEAGGAGAGDPPADLVAQVASEDPEDVARELHGLREQVADLRDRLDDRESRVEELESSLKRAKADFQNYKKRQERRREQERQRATEDLVERLLDVRDNLSRALDVEGDVREGVDSTLRQFDRILEEENVAAIDPAPGDEVDPQRHEVLMRVDADHPEGAVADVHRPGYEMGEKVLRPAQVTVSDESDGGDGEEDGAGA